MVNLRIMEKEDLPLIVDWFNNPDFLGEFWDYFPLQRSTVEIEKVLEGNLFEQKYFMIEKKDGSKIGYVSHFCTLHPLGKLLEIGYVIAPNQRRKGYCTEAVRLILDYLFLSRSVERIQASTHADNRASQRVLEKTGFKKEGIMRRALFNKGDWKDGVLYSILREEWKRTEDTTRTEKLNKTLSVTRAKRTHNK
jgi:RimJ/RimL family protein N-acetyltransferase